MAFVQSGSIWFPGNDAYYHLRMARLLPEWGFIQEFPWLHWTIFREAFVSHHHGFHILLAPFVWLSDQLTGQLLWGGKVFSVLAMGMTAVMLDAVLVTLQVRYRLAWVLVLLLLPSDFWLRHTYVRAQVVALPIMLAAVVLVLKNRPFWLAILSFVFVHVYGGGVLFPLIPISFVVGHLVRKSLKREHVVLFLSCIAGLIAGLVINPYFPANLAFLRTQIFDTGLGAPKYVGGEWLPYDFPVFIRMVAPVLVIWVICLISSIAYRRSLDGRAIAFIILNFLFLILTIKARRFIEYWPVFVLLNAAELAGRLPSENEGNAAGKKIGWSSLLVSAGLVSVFLLAGFLNLMAVRKDVRPKRDYVALAGAMDWLKGNSPRGSLIFTDDWDVFPIAFYFNQYNHFSVGLDPMFTQIRYPELWERYTLITQGQSPARLAGSGDQVTLTDIKTHFHADYVLVENDHPPIYRQLMNAKDAFERVYPLADEPNGKQPSFSVFRVK